MCLRALWTTLFSFLLAVPGFAFGAGELATVTILDGDATLMRASTRLVLAEGVRLQADDIAETADKARMLRIEFNDGLILDLGPGSRALVAPKFSGDKARSARFYLMQGWAKVTVPKTTPPPPANFASPAFDVTALTRQIVVSLQPGEALLFAEAGEATLVERKAGKPLPPLVLKSDQFLARMNDDKPAVTPRPTQAFIQRLPRPFLDTLPSRAAVFKAREVEPKKLADITLPDAQPWVDAEAALRPAFLARWKPLAANPEFRKGLLSNERAHPEWDRVLHPEKYLPKPSPSASGVPRGYPAR